MCETGKPCTTLTSLFRNYISFVGAGIATAALTSIVLLFLVEISSHQENPYHGILTYIIFPSILLLGIFIVVLGMVVENHGPDEAPKLLVRDTITGQVQQ